MATWLIVAPLLAAGAALAVPNRRLRPWVVTLGGAVHLTLTVVILTEPGDETAWGGWLVLDPLGKVFLLLVSVLFFLCAWYLPGYLALRQERPNRVLCACLLASLSMMTLVTLSYHLGLMWVAMEASTLVTAPGIYFNHNRRSLEATWKYLLVCSVGIALALLGSFFLAYAALYAGQEPTLLFDDLVRQAPGLSAPWLRAAFALLLVGYGTKMGLAPMHTWKPDAYGESPGVVAALMAGGLTGCAFLAILRVFRIAGASGQDDYARQMLVFMGLLSMGLAAVFMTRQRDIKRLLAYSSVEHMGILVFGVGVGGLATVGALQHVIHNGLTKVLLFLAAANVHRAYGSKFAGDLKGVVWRLPFSGCMLLAGFFAITGSPPFAPFVSEFQVLSGAFSAGHYWGGGLFLLFLFVVFVGMGVTVVSISLGKPTVAEAPGGYRDRLGTRLPLLTALALVVLLGVYNPPELDRMTREAAGALEVRP
jgi:hydrogenase-4 component F